MEKIPRLAILLNYHLLRFRKLIYSVITLTLLHPTQSCSVQNWTFEHEPSIRIGRSNDNDVVIYSAVVSRHHVELWQNADGWEVVSFGANGTYLDDQPVTQVAVFNGMIIRLGSSGPRIQINFLTNEPDLTILESQDQPLSTDDVFLQNLSSSVEDTDLTRADFG